MRIVTTQLFYNWHSYLTFINTVMINPPPSSEGEGLID